MYEDTSVLVINAVVFILALTLAVNAFRNYSTLKEILVIMSANNKLMMVKWSLDKLNLPVFTNSTESIEKTNNFNHNLTNVSHCAEYIQNIIIYNEQHEALIKADCMNK